LAEIQATADDVQVRVILAGYNAAAGEIVGCDH